MLDTDLENIRRIEELILSLEEVLFSLNKRYEDKVSLQITEELSHGTV